jgi:NADPH:quinone reductase-like Zn-dependent oxidoreductase
MLAIRYVEYGGPDVLVPTELPDLEPGPGEVVVEVHAAALNSTDVQLRAGKIPGRGTPPFVLGLDVSGLVAQVASDVTDLKVGDRVIGYLSPIQGGYATQVRAPVGAFVPAPAAVDHAHAAALPLAGLTALQVLDFAGVVTGQRVLVHAAAGGVGHLAVQLAAGRGAEVIATGRSANHQFLRELGAVEVIDYTDTDFATKLGVDVVLDLVGGEYGIRSLDTLAENGLLVGLTMNAGVTEQDAVSRRLRYTWYGLHPSPEDLRTLVGLVEAGSLKTSVEAVLPLNQAAQAHRIMEQRRVRGKLVLDPRQP